MFVRMGVNSKNSPHPNECFFYEISGACQIPPWNACPDLRHGRKAMMSWWGNLRKTHSFVWCWSRNTNSEKKHEQAWRTKHMVPLTLEHALTCILFQDSYWTLRSFFWVWGDVFFWFTDFPVMKFTRHIPLPPWLGFLGGPKGFLEKEVRHVMLNDITWILGNSKI